MDKKLTPFGEFYRELRKERKQTLKEAAQLLGVSIAYISSVEHGERELPLSWYPKIVNAYELDESHQKDLKNAFKLTPSNQKISINDIRRALTNMIKNMHLGPEKEKRALDDLERRIDELRSGNNK